MDSHGLSPLDATTASRLDRIEYDVHKLTNFLDEARPWLDEWVGRNGNRGLRVQVIEALDERRAAKVGGAFAKWMIGLGSGLLGLWAVLHEIFKR
jgi:hypothetical protein